MYDIVTTNFTMSSTSEKRRPVRIGGASGGFTDRVAAIARLASDPEVDAVVGDWLSEEWNVITETVRPRHENQNTLQAHTRAQVSNPPRYAVLQHGRPSLPTGQ